MTQAAQPELQEMCERGQEHLVRTEYLQAEAALAEAERRAWVDRDWDTLARLYMPLQEARRQRRQRCGEGVVCLDLLAAGPADHLDPMHVVQNYPHGQLLVAGWGSLAPAVAVRDLAARHELYLETFLAATFPVGSGGVATGRAVVITPLPDVALPAPDVRPIDALLAQLPAQCVVLAEGELPRGTRRGDVKTYAGVMTLWERLHLPFLAGADMQVDPVQKMEGYRKTIRVDYACELAHQKLSDTAHAMLRRQREGTGG